MSKVLSPDEFMKDQQKKREDEEKQKQIAKDHFDRFVKESQSSPISTSEAKTPEEFMNSLQDGSKDKPTY